MTAPIRSIFVLTAAALLTCGCDGKREAAAPATSAVSPEQLAANARDAYVFTYPLVLNYRTMYMQAIKGDGAFGKWVHLGLASPADTDIVTPNNDTPYSHAWVDVRAEPWVLTMPKIEATRFYTSQWDDFWGYVIDNPGSVLDGNEGANYLLASPGWNGELPPGISRVIRGETDLLGTLTRTQVVGGESDLPRVRQIQQSYKLQPLSAFLGKAAPAPAPAIDWLAWNEGDENREAYWNVVSLLLPLVKQNAADSAEYAKLASLGLEAGKPWQPEKLDAATRAALKSGIETAQAEMKKLSEGGVDAARFFGTRETVGTNYMDRAMGVYMGIFGNVPKVSYYISMPADSEGQPLDGSKAAYSITFPKGQIPPVKYFWSITMYSIPQRFLVENPIQRYSIGGSTPGLKTNPDGSLVIYVSAKSPGKGKESNWLPAPSGPFWTVLRTYGPDDSILDGSYKRPDYLAQPLN